MLATHNLTTQTILKSQFFLRWTKIIAVSTELLHAPVISWCMVVIRLDPEVLGLLFIKFFFLLIFGVAIKANMLNIATCL